MIPSTAQNVIKCSISEHQTPKCAENLMLQLKAGNYSFYYVTDNVITFCANVAMCGVLILAVPKLQTQVLIVRISLIPQEEF